MSPSRNFEFRAPLCPGIGAANDTALPPNTISASEFTNLDGRDVPLWESIIPVSRNWLAEIVDSMAWSAQMFGAVQSGAALD